MNEVSLRNATAADLPAISAIYNYYVLHSTCTYQLDPETLADRQAWFEAHAAESYPVVVAELGGQVVGWGSLSKFHARAGYKPSVEASVYIAAGFHRRGLGRMLLEHLIERAGRPAFTPSSAAPVPTSRPASPCRNPSASSAWPISRKSARSSGGGWT